MNKEFFIFFYYTLSSSELSIQTDAADSLFQRHPENASNDQKTHLFTQMHRELAGERGVPLRAEAKEARTLVYVQNDKGCFYTCHDPFNHLPLQTGEAGARGLPAAFAPFTQQLGTGWLSAEDKKKEKELHV